MAADPPDEAGTVEVEEMIGRLGLAMLAAGYAVTDIGSTLRRVAQVSGREEMSVGALPNAILIDDPAVQRARVADMAPGTALRFDFVVGLLVGAILVGEARVPQLAGVMPFFLGFRAAVLVFAAGAWLHLGTVPLYAVFAPIVVLVPGAMITNAVIELAAGDVVSGGGHLVSGLVTWLMLLLGILLGAGVVGVLPGELVVGPLTEIPLWAPWLGLLVMGVGITVTNSASPRLGVVVVVLLLMTYTIVAGVGALTSTIIAGGIAAAVMLVLARLVESGHRNLPTIVTFRPAFWLLVPGSMGLATLTAIAGARTAAEETLITMVCGTVLAISLGVQIGVVVSEAVTPHPTVDASP